MSRPTISRPRLRMLATAASASAWIGERAQAGGAVAVLLVGRRRPHRLGRQFLHARGRGRGQRHAGHRHHRRRLSAARQHHHRGKQTAEPQRCSAKCSSPVLTQSWPQPQRHRQRRADADSTAAPTVAPDSTRRALRMSLRNWLRLSSMPLLSAAVELVERRGRVVLAGAERHLGGGLVVADRDVGVDPVVGRPPPGQQLLGVLPGRSCRSRRRGRGSRTVAAASCRCVGSRTACGRPRRRAGSTTASRRRGPAAR